MNMFRKWIFLFISILFAIPVACQKTYTLTPLAATATPVVTNTPTKTPTGTPTPTATPSGSIPLAYTCASDATSGFPTSGAVTLSNPTRSFVPLCNGWVFVGDRNNNQIDLLNVVSNSVSQTYQLSASPNEMVFDSTNSYLYVALNGANSLARVNVVSGVVTNIALSYPVTELTMGPSGKVFCELMSGGPWWDIPIELVNGVAGAAVTTYNGWVEGYLSYDFAHNRLIRGQYNISSGPLLQYNFNNVTNALSAAQTVNTGTFIWGLTVSPDGNHAAFLEGLNTADVDTTNLNNNFGSWPNGVKPQAGAFSPNSQYFIDASSSASPATLTVYSVATHALYQSYGIGSVGYGVNRVGFSNGGQIVYGLDKDFNGNSSVIHWHLFP